MIMDLSFYLRLMLRRLPAMAALFLLCFGVSVVLAYKLPTKYDSNARLLVEAAQINSEAGVNPVAAAEQLEIIQQRLMTRANLIDIANEHDVFGDTRSMSPDEIVRTMRASTTIRRSSGRNQATLMSIRFSAENARVTAAVVNAYVTLILQENTRFRTGLVKDNLQFFDQEVDRLSQNLNQQSERILAFQAANADSLPDDQEYRLARQDNLLERGNIINRELAQLRDQRSRIVTVYEATGRLQQSAQRQLSPEEQQLKAAQAELTTALTIFSEANPRVKVLQNQVAQLESAVAAQRATDQTPKSDDQNTLLEATLAQLDGQIDTLEAAVAENEAEQAEIQIMIERTPANQISLGALERDYQNIQTQYNEAIARRNAARIGERIELSSKGQRISVIEQASIPTDPSSPNRPLIVIAGLAMGLGLAAGLFILLELLNRSVRHPEEIKNALGIEPLVTIPRIETTTTRRLRWVNRAATLGIAITGVPAALWSIDQYYFPLPLLANRVLSWLGLA